MMPTTDCAGMSASGPKLPTRNVRYSVAIAGIVLQNSR